VSASPEPAEPRVVVVEDHHLFAQAMELALTAEGYDVRRVAPPDNPAAPGALVSAVARHQPLVVLLDLDLGSFGDGVRVVEPLRQTGAHVVVVTGSGDRARWGAAVRAGARTVLSKTQPLEDVVATVRRIRTGLPVMDRAERDELVDTWTRSQLDRKGLRTKLEQLSIRESQVLSHLMRGRTVREIAALSGVSEATVRTQVKSILSKLQVSSQLAAAGLAHEVGWRAPVG